MNLSDYLNKPCDDGTCSHPATHNQQREGGIKWCDKHTDRTQPARARNG